MDKKEPTVAQEKPQEQSKDYELTLKKKHTHAGIEYPPGTELGVFKPDPVAVAYMKKHKVI